MRPPLWRGGDGNGFQKRFPSPAVWSVLSWHGGGGRGCEGTIPTIASPQDLQDLLKQPAGGLRACTDNVWRLFGLSLAAYNVVLQLAAAATAVVALRMAWWNRSDR